jgi:hypothetical protein
MPPQHGDGPADISGFGLNIGTHDKNPSQKCRNWLSRCAVFMGIAPAKQGLADFHCRHSKTT